MEKEEEQSELENLCQSCQLKKLWEERDAGCEILADITQL